MKKVLFGIIMSLVMAVSLAGCSFQVGNVPEYKTKSYKQAFPDSTHTKKYKMINYNYSLDGFGKMVIYLDTTDGYSLEMVENSANFKVLNEDKEAVLFGGVVDENAYKVFTSAMKEVRTINGRDFFVSEAGNGEYDAFSYMADCGLNAGLVLETNDEELFKIIAFDGTPIEGSSSDIYYYQGKAEETTAATVETSETLHDGTTTEPAAPSDNSDKEIAFSDGKSFKLTNYDFTHESGYTYRIVGSDSYLEAGIFENMSASEAGDAIAKALEENSGITPVVDIHDEGIYITGILNQQFDLAFIRDGGKGIVYCLNLITVDKENSLEIMNSIVDDFLASGIAGEAERTVYGQPVGESETAVETEAAPQGDLYYIVPSGFECYYSCEYFNSYNGEDMNITFNFSPDAYIKDYLDGKTTDYLGIYELKTIKEFDSSYGKITVIEGTSNSIYTYYAASEDGVFNVEFSHSYGYAVSGDDCEAFLKKFIK